MATDQFPAGPPRLSAKEADVLKLLIDDPSELYGFDMVERSKGKLKLGTLYTTLNRMEDKGYVTSRKEEPRPGARGLPRRLYRPSGLGSRVYAAHEAAAEKWQEGMA